MKKSKEKSITQFYKKFYKDYYHIIWLALICLVILPICLYVFALTPSSMGFMSPEDARVWLTYYGAIAGGAITLCGVAWTINNQRKLRINDLENQFKPLIVFDNLSLEILGNENERDKILSIKGKVRNLGRGTAINIKTKIEFDKKVRENYLLGSMLDYEVYFNDIPYILPASESFNHPFNVRIYMNESFTKHYDYLITYGANNEFNLYISVEYKSEVSDKTLSTTQILKLECTHSKIETMSIL